MAGRALLTWKGAPWVVGSLLLLVAAFSLYAFTGAAASEPSKSQPPGPDDITLGPADAQVSVIEYSDFQCPFCAEYAKMLATLREKYGDRVQFVYRFFPLANHEYATIAAKAAYAAHLQGKFWEMHDLLYGRQDEWSESSDPRPFFDSYAESLGLDIDQFHADADAQTTLDVINAQAQEGKRAGVKHTPWFVIDGSVVLPRSVEEFEDLIEAGL
jgi:protein-disulfide isomerase